MKLKFPPVFIVTFTACAMFLLAKFLPVGHFSFFGRSILMVVFLVLAVIIGLFSLVQFYNVKTSINPSKPSKASVLVTSGLYKYSRNPMYLGLLILLICWGLYLGNAFNILLVASFVSYMNVFQIQPEEESLHITFGKAYQKYCTQVRRWF